MAKIFSVRTDAAHLFDIRAANPNHQRFYYDESFLPRNFQQLVALEDRTMFGEYH